MGTAGSPHASSSTPYLFSALASERAIYLSSLLNFSWFCCNLSLSQHGTNSISLLSTTAIAMIVMTTALTALTN